ncbi:unnamed protein product [Rotaria sp. Silwood1]|nr:unnamed protein product [Rotaria sp. Silwood1]
MNVHLFLSYVKKLTSFNMNIFTNCEQTQLLLYGRPPSTGSSSQLRSLSVNMASFKNCLCLPDGGVNQLSS